MPRHEIIIGNDSDVLPTSMRGCDDEDDFCVYDDEDDFEDEEELEQEEIPIEQRYYMSVIALDELNDRRNDKFGQEYYSQFQIDHLIALRRLPGLLSNMEISDFESDIFPIIMEIATQSTDNTNIDGLIMPFDELMSYVPDRDCDSNVSVNAYREVDERLFLFESEPDIILMQIEKCLLLELMPEILHDFLYCVDYSVYDDENVFLYECKNILHFVMPLMLGLILSSYDIGFLNRAYQILSNALDEMASLARTLTVDYLAFSKVQHYKLPYIKRSNLIDQRLYYQDILEEFCEIISYYFVLFPYLRLSLTSYRIDVDSVRDSLFCIDPLVCLCHFESDDYSLLRCAVYPHSDQADDFIDMASDVSYEKVDIIMDNIRKEQLQLEELYIEIIQEMSPFYSMRVSIPILTVLIKQLNGRPLHSQFIKDLSDRFFVYKGKLIKHYIKLIHHNIEEKDDFSLNAPQSLLSNDYRVKVLTAISTVLNDSHRFALQKSQKFAAIQEEIIHVLLRIVDADVKMKIPYFLPTFMRGISTEQKLQCCEYYYIHIKSKNKRVVQQFVISLGSFLPEMLDLKFDGIIIDAKRASPQFNEQLGQLLELITFYLDLSNYTFEFSKLNIAIKDCTKFQRIFIEKNLVELPKVCKLYLELLETQNINIPAVQRERLREEKEYALAQYIMNEMRESQPINQRYALANEYLRNSTAFKFVLDLNEQKKIFIDILFSMINLSQMKLILSQQHLDDQWLHLKDRFRDFALKLFFNSVEERRNEGQMVTVQYETQDLRFYLNGELYTCSERFLKPQHSGRFNYVVTNARNYGNRLEYATYLPSVIDKFAIDKETLDYILIEVLDLVFYFIQEPVRKIRTTFCREFGILTGMLINRGIDISSILALIYKLITNQPLDSGEFSTVLEKIIPKYRPTVQTKCLMTAVLYQVIRISEEKAYSFISPHLILLASDGETIVKSSVIKNMLYLAKNKCRVIFGPQYLALRKSLLYNADGGLETDRVILDFDELFQSSLEQFLAHEQPENQEE